MRKSWFDQRYGNFIGTFTFEMENTSFISEPIFAYNDFRVRCRWSFIGKEANWIPIYIMNLIDDNNRRKSLAVIEYNNGWNSKLAISTPHTEHSTIAYISIFHRKWRKQSMRGMLTASEMNRLGIHWNVYINQWKMQKTRSWSMPFNEPGHSICNLV